MRGLFRPLKPISAGLKASVWTLRGRRRLRRGEVQSSIQAFHLALEKRPKRFRTLIDLATAHLCARDVQGASRALSTAREAHPSRYDAQAGRLLARWGFDIEAVGRMSAQPRPRVTQVAVVRPREVTAQSLPFGDCRNLDEYARFRAMPPISRAEIEGLDWDRVIDDLLEE